MISDIAILSSAFGLGLVGSIHCAMMCSGFVVSLHRSGEISGEQSASKLSIAFNSGRIFSYGVAGAIASWFGAAIVQFLGIHQSHSLMQILVGGFLILMGLNISGWWNGLSWVEKGGSYFWRLIHPLTRYVFPVTSYRRAVAAGALWGWLPCGLVYSALVLVMGAEKPLIGAAAMVLFGLGTTPLMALVGISSNKVRLSNKPEFKKSDRERRHDVWSSGFYRANDERDGSPLNRTFCHDTQGNSSYNAIRF